MATVGAEVSCEDPAVDSYAQRSREAVRLSRGLPSWSFDGNQYVRRQEGLLAVESH
jgi:hypothetical protein